MAILLSAFMVQGCATGGRGTSKATALNRPMLTTGYCHCKQCTNWKRNWRGKAVIASGASKGTRKKVGITAAGTVAKHGTIAADTSRYPFGTVMYIPGYGYGRVEDRGSAITGEHIDLYFPTHQKALEWGKRNKTVKVWARR